MQSNFNKQDLIFQLEFLKPLLINLSSGYNITLSQSLSKTISDLIVDLNKFTEEVKNDKLSQEQIKKNHEVLMKRINEFNNSHAIQSPKILNPESREKILHGIDKIILGFNLVLTADQLS
jgi:hypothetical protein